MHSSAECCAAIAQYTSQSVLMYVSMSTGTMLSSLQKNTYNSSTYLAWFLRRVEYYYYFHLSSFSVIYPFVGDYPSPSLVMEEEGIDDELMHPLSGLFENCYNATAIDENYAVVKELLKEWSITSLIYLWVCVREAVEAIPLLSAAIIRGILDVCKNRYYFYGSAYCNCLLTV